MTPTNWPNPERPGVPMFPERDGKHVIDVDPEGSGSDLVYYWIADHQIWVEYEEEGPDDALNEYDTHGWSYVGPVLTPTQLTEMMEGDRNSDLHCALMDSIYVSGMKVGWNCAQDDDSARYNSIKEKILQDRIDSGVSFSERSKAIRNLGDAP